MKGKKIIGIDASRAFLKNKTGVEVCSFEIIGRVARRLAQGGFYLILYVKDYPSLQEEKRFWQEKKPPLGVEFKRIPFQRFWTQVGLSLEMWLNPVDLLLVPAHIIPLISPSKTILVVHGLEYEKCYSSYSFLSRLFHRFFIKNSAKKAQKIVAVSHQTKEDLINFYKIDPNKIVVISNGFNPVSNNMPSLELEKRFKKQALFRRILEDPFILFIGRLEKRKNLEKIIEAFEIIKKEFSFQGKLVLVGKEGQGFEKMKALIEKSPFKEEIIQTGFLTEKEKNFLFSKATVFLFPSLCEGFGIPLLEAQSAGVPVITSNIAPLNEIVPFPECLVDPSNSREIAWKTFRIITHSSLREKIVQKGKDNLKKFSWEKTAKQYSEIIKSSF